MTVMDDIGWVTKLNNRSVLSVRGPDSTHFLQGLISNDMRLFEREKERAALFTCFMNVKGKVLFDAIIAKPLLANQDADDAEFWIDIADSDCDALMKHLKVNNWLFKQLVFIYLYIEICYPQKA
jgi:folate-binding Fe-S cluster repair protein YgfZ